MSIFALAYNLEYNSFDLNKSKKVIRIPFNKPCIVTTHYQVAKKNRREEKYLFLSLDRLYFT